MTTATTKFRASDPIDAERIPQLRELSAPTLAAMRRVTHVLPFRLNPYVVSSS